MMNIIERGLAWLSLGKRKSSTLQDWQKRLQLKTQSPLARLANVDSYIAANTRAVSTALAGYGPDAVVTAAVTASEVGARMVVNISAAHVPALCEATRKGDKNPYKNGYDLGNFYRLGEGAPNRVAKTREVVDAALPLPRGSDVSKVYFGAMELNGTGVHFYGDMCLVLKTVDPETRMLDRNSYDLVRAPLRDEIESGLTEAQWPAARAKAAFRMHGVWQSDKDSIAAVKVFDAVGFRGRRLTTGQISSALRDDEDYVEILRIGSFGIKDVREVRVSAADVACDAAVDARRRGATPSVEMILWRDRRRVAELELARDEVPVRIVTTSGRIKG